MLNLEKREPIIAMSSILGDRETQQDFVKSSEEVSEWDKDLLGIMGIVCDGMGGLSNGAEASMICADTIMNEYKRMKHDSDEDICKILAELIITADHEVLSINTSYDRPHCGTTAVVAVIKNNIAYWISVGDSRIYHITEHEIKKLNRDHNYDLALTAMAKAGEISESELMNNPNRNALISFVGKGEDLIMDSGELEFIAGKDVLLMCSDGLYKSLNEDDIFQIVSDGLSSPGFLPKKLTDASTCDKSISHDNTSVLIFS